MDDVRDLGVTRGVGRVLGLWILQKVSELERNQFGQVFIPLNLTYIYTCVLYIGLNVHFVCNCSSNQLHPIGFPLNSLSILLMNAASFIV